jgi:hypothetical protein
VGILRTVILVQAYTRHIAGQMRKKLEGLSRKEIQQLAMDANLKANQKTASLIEQLALLAERRRTGRGSLFPLKSTRTAHMKLIILPIHRWIRRYVCKAPC